VCTNQWLSIEVLALRAPLLPIILRKEGLKQAGNPQARSSKRDLGNGYGRVQQGCPWQLVDRDKKEGENESRCMLPAERLINKL